MDDPQSSHAGNHDGRGEDRPDPRLYVRYVAQCDGDGEGEGLGEDGVPRLARRRGREVVLQRGQGSHRGEDEVQPAVGLGLDPEVDPGERGERRRHADERPQALLVAEAGRDAGAALSDFLGPPREPALQSVLRSAQYLLRGEFETVGCLKEPLGKGLVIDPGTARPVRFLLCSCRVAQRTSDPDHHHELGL